MVVCVWCEHLSHTPTHPRAKAVEQGAGGHRCWVGVKLFADVHSSRPRGRRDRCCLELGPLRGYRRGEGRGCQGRECKRLIAPRGEVEVVWSCSCRNRTVVALDGQDKDAPPGTAARSCLAHPSGPGGANCRYVTVFPGRIQPTCRRLQRPSPGRLWPGTRCSDTPPG